MEVTREVCYVYKTLFQIPHVEVTSRYVPFPVIEMMIECSNKKTSKEGEK